MFSLFFILLIVLLPTTANAIPPPDFIFNFLSQIPQFILSVGIVLSAGLAIGRQYLIAQWHVWGWKKLLTFSLLVILLALLVTYKFAQFSEHARFEKWRKTQLANVALPPSVQKGRLRKGRIFLNLSQSASDNGASEFFLRRQSLPLYVTNYELRKALESAEKNFIVLDAREDLEFTLGHFKNALHIRYADLVAGEWRKLSGEKIYYVFCYSAIRGSEVAEFLRSKNVLAQFIEEGARGWVDFGGAWDGDLDLSKKYTAPQYSKKYSMTEFKAAVLDSTITIIDSRSPENFSKYHFQNAINISTLKMPRERLEKALNSVPNRSKVLIICNDHWSCFDAYLTGIALETRGHIFLGRFDKYSKNEF